MTFWFAILKQDYIEELTMTCDIFCNELIPIAKSKWDKEDSVLRKEFDDYSMRSKMLRQYRSDNIRYDLPEDFIVPEEYQLDSLLQEWHMKYNSYLRISGMGLTNVVMLWEQQLFDQMKHFDEKTTNFYGTLSKLCSKHTNHDLANDEKIAEIRHLVNAIKHGKGADSYTELEKMSSKYLKNDVASQFSELEERYLYIDLSISDIQSITEYLINFWRTFKFNNASIDMAEN